ncbi:MAG: uracil-DNA glycosylase [Myxococcota bacterium]|jgi:DNA polymerase|nr:uracil-DNA glycosylase [Myxococcota bacterium]
MSDPAPPGLDAGEPAPSAAEELWLLTEAVRGLLVWQHETAIQHASAPAEPRPAPGESPHAGSLPATARPAGRAAGRSGTKGPPIEPAGTGQKVPRLDPARAQLLLAELLLEARRCQACPRRQPDTEPSFGTGGPHPLVLFLTGVATPGETGGASPFTGEAAELFDAILAKGMGLTPDQVFTTPLVKCPSPQPAPRRRAEARACLELLDRQITVLQPSVLVPLGEQATSLLLDDLRPFDLLRQGWHRYGDLPVRPTFSPEQLVRSPADKRLAWSDIKEVLTRLGRKPPRKSG